MKVITIVSILIVIVILFILILGSYFYISSSNVLNNSSEGNDNDTDNNILTNNNSVLQICDAINPCSKEGEDCYKLEGKDKAYCYPAGYNICSECSVGKCSIAESYPAQVFCK